MLHQNGRDSHGEAQRLFPVVHATQKLGPSQSNMNQQPDDMMAPQSISFIGDEDENEEIDEADNYQAPRQSDNSIGKSFIHQDDLEISLGKLNITSGSRTYRIPSPTTRNHPGLAANSFRSMESQNDSNEAENEKGFYISFDNETQPKRPKPPLRTKRSPKKPTDDQATNYDIQEVVSKKEFTPRETYKAATNERLSYDYDRSKQPVNVPKESKALIIGNDDAYNELVKFSKK